MPKWAWWVVALVAAVVIYRMWMARQAASE